MKRPRKFEVGDMVVLNKEKIEMRKMSDADKLTNREIFTVMGIKNSNYSGLHYYLNKGADWMREDELVLWRSHRDYSSIV